MKIRRLLPAAILTVSLLLSFSALADPIQFSAPDSYTISAVPFRMTSGDFNNDGYPDLVVVDNNNYYSILMNNGSGGFTAANYVIAGAGLRDAVVVNLAGDAIPDLVLSDSSGSKIRVLTGSGTGTFTLSASISLSGAGDGIASGDFNGDGYPDVAVCQRTTSKVSVLLGTSGGSFGAATPNTTGACNDLAVGLVNADGYQDIVTANGTSNSISVLLGNGDGTFGAATNIATGGNNTDVALADIDHDGKLDAVVASYANSAAVILLGDGAGGFTLSQSLALNNNPNQVRIADFNQDGFLDIATANSGYNQPGLSILQATGYNTFMAVATFHADQAANGLALADFNHDGGLDVATSHPNNNTVRVMKVIVTDDTDGDGMPNAWENQYPCLNPLVGDSTLDPDGDGLRNIQEYGHLTNPCVADTDGDGLSDGAELNTYSTDPHLIDTDSDGMPDGWEVADACLNPLMADGSLDYDSDQLTNLQEYQYSTDPCVWSDSDGDGMPDGWEVQYACVNRLVNDAGLDPDADTLTNLQEYLAHTNPCVPNDTDGDGMPDYYEALHPCLNPAVNDASSDSDGDLWTNIYEYVHGSDPCVFTDTDGDGMPNAWEIQYASCGLNPNVNDAGLDPDADNLTNLQEYQAHTSPCASDTDHDGMPDGWEAAHACMKPTVADAGLDYDFDQATNLQEYQLGTDPCVGTDTDGDGMPDGWEIMYACVNRLVNDASLDPDADALTNLQEYQAGTNPCVQNDTDADGMPDIWENAHPCMNHLVNDAALDYDTDQLTNHQEYQLGTDPCVWTDSDGDGMPDGWQIKYTCTNRLVNDANLDPDNDGLTNLQEYQAGTNPCIQNDTDGDGMPDIWENAHPCMRPAVADAGLDYDADSLTNLYEFQHGSDPCAANGDGDAMPDVYEDLHSCLLPLVNDAAADPDGDGMSNLYEYQHGTDPCSPPMPMIGDWQGPTTIACGVNVLPSYLDPLYPDVQNPGPVLETLVDGNGTFHLAWIDSNANGDDTIYYATRGPAGWSAPEPVFLPRISAGNAHNLRMAVDANNQVYLMWGSGFWTKTSTGWVQFGSGFFGFCCDMDVSDTGQLYSLCDNGVNIWDGTGWTLIPGSYTGCSPAAIAGLAVAPSGHLHVAYNYIPHIGADGHLYHQEYSSQGGQWSTEQLVSSDGCNCVGGYNVARVRVDSEGQPAIYEHLGRLTHILNYQGDSRFFRRSPAGIWNQLRGSGKLCYTCFAVGELDWITLYSIDFSPGPFSWMALFRVPGCGYSPQGTIDLFFPDGTVTRDVPTPTPSQMYPLYDPVLTGDALHLIAASTDLTCLYDYTLPIQRDDDQDQMPDNWERGFGCLNPHFNDAGLDADGDGLTNLQEYAAGTDPCSWDSDGDNLPDGYEAAHGLNPLSTADGAADADGDGNSNANEYYNGSDPWMWDPAPGRFDNPGCFYWGDGDGDGVPSPVDVAKLKMEIAGIAQNYDAILPHTAETLDLDRDGTRSPLDLALMLSMVAGAEMVSGYPSQAAALEVVASPTGSVAVGSTTHVTVSVHSVSGEIPYAPGFGVVFEVVSGNAVLLGGDGTADGEAAGNRYDVSMEAASGARANMVVLITGSGPITIGVKVPGCGTAPYGRWNDEVVLSPEVVINP